MKKITQEDLKRILDRHAAWLSGEGGERADLSDADLSDANLSGADLSGAKLTGASMFKTSMFKASLTGADLFGANLFGANLFGADLFDANLMGADLTGTCLTGAKLTGAKGVVDLGWPDKYRAIGWWKEGIPWVRVGGHTMSLSAGLQYWSDHLEVFAALLRFQEIVDARKEG